MHIHRSTILIILALLIMAPSLRDWVMTGGLEWYRIFIAWLFVILIVAWNQRITSRKGPSRAE